ncbi:predicted protein [Botrytis cinerea T4]|uniref:Uncharacterized protein n=1 Tax=Botryotinia fuckeliana (strain T4) TaxID=999810 RepID=G2XWW2_BOTF4|nr:predicted protein [Botrytis cinerea T4]
MTSTIFSALTPTTIHSQSIVTSFHFQVHTANSLQLLTLPFQAPTNSSMKTAFPISLLLVL